MTDTPMNDAESLLAQVAHLRQMWRDATCWKSAYTETEWHRTEQFYLVMIQIRYERLLALKPDDETAQRGLETAVNILAAMGEHRRWNLMRTALHAGRAGPDAGR